MTNKEYWEIVKNISLEAIEQCKHIESVINNGAANARLLLDANDQKFKAIKQLNNAFKNAQRHDSDKAKMSDYYSSFIDEE